MPSSFPARSRRYWLRLAVFFGISLIVGLALVPFMLGVLSMWGITHPPCNIGGDPSGFNPAYESVSFTSTNGLQQQGYFIPGTNGATIIVVPAFANGRGAELHYAEVFNQAGFNVMTLNSRVCTSQGRISLGYRETEDVQAAYAYLETREDVDLARVGLHGFSSAGATSMMAAAQMPEIVSVSAEGGYHDYPAVMGIGQGGSFFEELYKQGAYRSYGWITGEDIHNLSPISMIDGLAGRHLLLIYGNLEVSLPGARQMLERALAAGVDADLWVVEGAGHGGYLGLEPEEFPRRVVGFHETALLVDKP